MYSVLRVSPDDEVEERMLAVLRRRRWLDTLRFVRRSISKNLLAGCKARHSGKVSLGTLEQRVALLCA